MDKCWALFQLMGVKQSIRQPESVPSKELLFQQGEMINMSVNE